MALGDKNKREELKKLIEKSSLSETTKQKIRDFVNELETGRLAMLAEDIKRREENN